MDDQLLKTERDYSELRESYDAVVAKLTIERAHGDKQCRRVTATEAKLARAVDGLEKSRDHFDFLTRMASGSAVFEIVDGKRIRRKLGEVIASEADEGSKHVRQTLAALQQEGE